MQEEQTLDPHLDLRGTHAFLFIDHVAESTTPERVVRDIWELGMPRVLFASAFVGEFQAFAHLRVEEEGLDGIGTLQDLIADDIVRVGARCSYGVETMIQPYGAKRRSPGLIVLTRIQVAPFAPIVERREQLGLQATRARDVDAVEQDQAAFAGKFVDVNAHGVDDDIAHAEDIHGHPSYLLTISSILILIA